MTEDDLINSKENLVTKDQKLEMDLSFLKEPHSMCVAGLLTLSEAVTEHSFVYYQCGE